MNIQKTSTLTRLIPLTEWSKHHPWPPMGGLRHLVFHAATNGFDKVVKRVSNRILIDEAAFFRWIEEKNAKANGGAHE